jgi:HK97 family phage major capsid protein
MTFDKATLRALPQDIYYSILSLSKGHGPVGLMRGIHEQALRDQKVAAATAKSTDANPPVFQDTPGSMLVPIAALQAIRALSTDTYNAGGAFVAEPPSTVSEMLRPISAITKAGAQIITGLRGNVRIPRQITDVTYSWLPEIAGTVTESDGTHGGLTLSPHRLSGATNITSQADVQTDGVLRALVMNSLARGVGVGVDLAALAGSGNYGEPLGLFNYSSGVSTVTFSAAATWANALSFVRKVGDAS